MEREELEAQLELKITTKAGSHHKLGKVCIQLLIRAFTLVIILTEPAEVCLDTEELTLLIYTTFHPFQIVQQLVEERLKMLELTIFDKHFQELKDRVDKIECATKHQTAINTLQVSTW